MHSDHLSQDLFSIRFRQQGRHDKLFNYNNITSFMLDQLYSRGRGCQGAFGAPVTE